MWRICVVLVASYLLSLSQLQSQGYLVIAGGGLKSDNAAIFEEFIRLAGGRGAQIGVIPSASGTPVGSFKSFQQIMVKYGLKESNIVLIPLATEDDPDTPENEALLKGNAFDSGVVRRIHACQGIWFTGGDQLRTTSVFLDKDGKSTPALDAVRQVLKRGGVVGGTSAGAAIQSSLMIGGGTSLGALTYGVTQTFTNEVDDKGVLLLTQGLGFFPYGIIDQHFDRKARLGRLSLALKYVTNPIRLGYGIDENTAMVVDLVKKLFYVKGVGGVTMIDASPALYDSVQGLSRIRNLIVSYLTSNDTVLLETLTMKPDRGKTPTRNRESYNEPMPASMGVLAGCGCHFKEMVSYYLVDNKATDTISALTVDQARGTGFMTNFYKIPESEGFYMDLPDDEVYSVWKIGVDILPIRFEINLIND